MHLIERPFNIPKDLFLSALFDPLSQLSRKYFLSQAAMGLDSRRRLTCLGAVVHPVLKHGSLDEVLLDMNPRIVLGPSASIPRDLKKRTGKSHRLGTVYIHDGNAWMLGNSPNRDAVESFAMVREDRFYCNVNFMATLMYMHMNRFGKSKKPVVDLTVGRGGSLIAGYELGLSHIIGFEINESNFRVAQQKFERHLKERQGRYRKKVQSNSVFYIASGNLQPTTIHLFNANSVTDAARILRSMGLEGGCSVVSDLPWGCFKCPAYADRKINSVDDMGRFHDGISRAINDAGIGCATLAQNRWANMRMNEVHRVKANDIYSVVQYRSQ